MCAFFKCSFKVCECNQNTSRENGNLVKHRRLFTQNSGEEKEAESLLKFVEILIPPPIIEVE